MPKELFPYQIDGVNKLIDGLPFLFDDMGLGKTVQLIKAVEEQDGQATTLVVCPNSLKYNWKNEIDLWCDVPYTTTILTGTVEEKFATIHNFRYRKTDTLDFLICNYDFFPLIQPINRKKLKYERSPLYVEMLIHMTQIKWDFVLFDEAHRLKGRKNDTFEAVKVAVNKAKKLYFATGTPILNNVEELFPLLYLYDRKRFSSFWEDFAYKYCLVEEAEWGKVVHPPTDNRLRTIVHDLMIRRTKEEVLPELPEKTVQQIWVELEGEQRSKYQQMEEEFLLLLDSGEFLAAKMVMDQIIRLKQICLSTDLFRPNDSLRGIKVDTLFELLPDKPTIIFTQFEKAATRLALQLIRKCGDTCLVTGNTEVEMRQFYVDEFQKGNIKYFVGSLLSCYQGFNLTASDTMFFLDKWWTPAINLQAQDRTRRIGQKKSVNIYELLVKNSVEEKIEEILQKKTTLFDDFFSKEVINMKDLRTSYGIVS